MMKVLIVDSDQTSCELLDSWLSSRGYEVTCAYDGMEGIKLYEKLKPDLVISEIMLPVINGYQLIRLILEGKKQALRPCNIIILTAVRRADSRNFCLELGATDVWLKPFDPEQLARSLEKHMPQEAVT